MTYNHLSFTNLSQNITCSRDRSESHKPSQAGEQRFRVPDWPMRRGSDDVTGAEHRPDDSGHDVIRRHITPTLLLVAVLPGHDVA